MQSFASRQATLTHIRCAALRTQAAKPLAVARSHTCHYTNVWWLAMHVSAPSMRSGQHALPDTKLLLCTHKGRTPFATQVSIQWLAMHVKPSSKMCCGKHALLYTKLPQGCLVHEQLRPVELTNNGNQVCRKLRVGVDQ